MKKLLSLMAVTTLSFVSFGQAFALSPAYSLNYSDINSFTKYYEAIEFITDEGIVSGYPDGTYRPKNVLNRAELLKIVIEAVYDDEFEAYSNSACFDDVPAGEWYTKYVCFAKDLDIVEGYAGNKFRPEDTISLVEGLKIVMEVFSYYYPESTPWYRGIVQEASYGNFIPLDFTYFSQDMNRGQMADMITRIVKYERDELSDYLGTLEEYVVTYETLDNNINVEPPYSPYPDETAPSDVEGVEVVALDGAVKLTWDEAYDNVGVIGYEVHYGKTSVIKAGQVYDDHNDAGDVLEYTVGGLKNGTKYYFSVIAYDLAGNESQAWSLEVSATPSANAQEDLMSAICGNDDADSKNVSCTDAKVEIYGCKWASLVTYYDKEFLMCSMTGVSGDDVLVYGGGMLSNGYTLYAYDDGDLEEIKDVLDLRLVWGDIDSKTNAREFARAATGYSEAYSVADLDEMYGEDFELTVKNNEINFSNVEKQDDYYIVSLYYKPTFGCSPFSVYEETYNVGGGTTFFEFVGKTKIGEVNSGMCVD